MRGLDTNVLVRYFTEDDPEQSQTVIALFEHTEAQEERLHVSTIALCEMVWVLRSRYRLNRGQLCSAIETILGLRFLKVQDSDLASLALEDFRRGPADFPDYLIGWQNRRAGCQDTMTFDGDLSTGTAGFTILR